VSTVVIQSGVEQYTAFEPKKRHPARLDLSVTIQGVATGVEPLYAPSYTRKVKVPKP